MASSLAERRAAYKARAQAKLDTCKACPFFERGAAKFLESCGRCGCFIRPLILTPGQACPDSRW